MKYTFFSLFVCYDMWVVYREIITIEIPMSLPLRLKDGTQPDLRSPGCPSLKISSPGVKDNYSLELF